MPDTAQTIARDLIAEIGRANAARYVAAQIVRHASWSARWQGAKLLLAIVLA